MEAICKVEASHSGDSQPAAKTCSTCGKQKLEAEFHGRATCIRCLRRKRQITEQASGDRDQAFSALVAENKRFRETVDRQTGELNDAQHWRSEAQRFSILTSQQQDQLELLNNAATCQLPLTHAMSTSIPSGTSSRQQGRAPSTDITIQPLTDSNQFLNSTSWQHPKSQKLAQADQPEKAESDSPEEMLPQEMCDVFDTIDLPKEVLPQEMCDVFDTWDANSLQALHPLWSEEIGSLLDVPTSQPLSDPSTGAGQGIGQYLTASPSINSEPSVRNNPECSLVSSLPTQEALRLLDLAADSAIPKTLSEILWFNAPVKRAFENSRLKRHHHFIRMLPLLPFSYCMSMQWGILPTPASLALPLAIAIANTVGFLCITEDKQGVVWHRVRRCCYTASLGFRIWTAFTLGPIYFDGTTPVSTLLYAAIYFSVLPIVIKLFLDPHWLWCLMMNHLIPVAVYLCTHSHLPDVYAQSEKYLFVMISSTIAMIMIIDYYRRVDFVNRLHAIKLAKETVKLDMCPSNHTNNHTSFQFQFQ